MKIWKLDEYPLMINDIALIRWEEWYKWNSKGIVLSDIVEETEKFSEKIFIALSNENILLWFWGIFDDSWIEKKTDWKWLKSLYVKHEYRQKWIATNIVKSIKNHIISNNESIYLYDSSWIDWFYEKQWFKFIEKYLFNKKYYFIYLFNWAKKN